MQFEIAGAGQLTSEQLSVWRTLHAQGLCGGSPFLRPEYVLAVARFRANVEVALAKSAGEIVAVFPFERVRSSLGQAAGGLMSDGDGIVAGQGVSVDLPALLRACSLSEWRFEHLDTAQALFKPYCSYLAPAAIIDLSKGMQHYLDTKSASGSRILQQSQRKKRKINRELGPVKFVFRSDEAEVLDKLLEMKSAQLAKKGKVDVFQEIWLSRTIKELAGIDHSGFTGCLSALYAGDKIIATHIGLRSHGVFTSWIPAYDMSFAAYSPGLVMHLELLQHTAEQGVEKIDLGRGINQLKSSLMTHSAPLAVGCVRRKRLRSRVRQFGVQVNYRMKKLIGRFSD